MGKFFTLIMNERLNKYLDENNIMSNCQIGFRKNYRTADHLLVLKTLIDYYKSKRKLIFACFIDFKKAYDSVWREGLFLKLILNGCSKRFIRLMLSMYSSYDCSVKLEEGYTTFFRSHVGVKQGCNLSPTLFNLFINDLSDIFDRSCTPVKLNDTNLSCLLYADDLVLLSESRAGLQNCLTKLVYYTKKWKLNINLKKSKVLVFGTPTQKRWHSTSIWTFGKNILEQVDEYCYLGITLHFSGTFKRAQKIIYGKALHAYHSIFKSFSNVENVPIKLMLKLFSSIVTPILLYGCEVWGPHLLGRINSFDMFKKKIFQINSAIEKLHLKFCKRVLGVHSKSTNMAIYAELGRTPLIVQIAKLVVKYWFRIKSSLFSNTLVGKAANVCMELNLKSTIFRKYALQLCGGENCDSQTELSNLQTELSDTEKGNVCHYVKRRFKEAFILYWAEQFQPVENTGKLRTFRKIKKHFECEKYLNEISNFKYRQAVTKLRISAHKLTVETGRYNNVPYNDRLCRLCELNEVGDEHHFLMSCTNMKFIDLRTKFIDNLYKINGFFNLFTSKNLFIYIMAMKDKSIMKLVGKYCFDVLAAFDSLV